MLGRKKERKDKMGERESSLMTRLDSKIYRVEHCYVLISHPWQRDTGKYAAQGPNIKLPEGPR